MCILFVHLSLYMYIHIYIYIHEVFIDGGLPLTWPNQLLQLALATLSMICAVNNHVILY